MIIRLMLAGAEKVTVILRPYDDAPDVLTGIIEKITEPSRRQIIS